MVSVCLMAYHLHAIVAEWNILYKCVNVSFAYLNKTVPATCELSPKTVMHILTVIFHCQIIFFRPSKLNYQILIPARTNFVDL